MSDKRRTDKFTYTDPRQIVTGKERIRVHKLRELRELVVENDLDVSRVIDLIGRHLDELRSEDQQREDSQQQDDQGT